MEVWKKFSSPRAFRGAGLVFAAVFASAVFLTASSAHATITVAAPPMDAVWVSPTVGGGAVVPLIRFQLVQSDGGSDTLAKVGFTLTASSTINGNPVASVGLYKESGAHPGFQINEDISIAGAASTSPAFGPLITLTPATAVSIGSSPTEFFIVASTTAVSGITNNNAFDTHLANNYASSTAGLGIGAAFDSTKKINLNQSGTLLISEVKDGATGNAGDEFVELYNYGDTDINLRVLPFNLHLYNAITGSSSPMALTYYKNIIPSHGYFLITHPTFYSGTVPPDAVFATTSPNAIISNGGLSIATSSGLVSAGTYAATSTVMDKICWGTGTPCEGSALADLGADTAYERKATSGSTAQSMAPGGADSASGNGYDSNNNSNDFVLQNTANPQNSSSPPEFPFGMGGQDNQKLQVMGSFPNQGMTNVPLDMSFIGFGFNKMVSSGSIVSATPTTTVTLTTGGGSNLCASTAYNPFPSSFAPPAQCNLTSPLSPSTTYTFTVTSGVTDLSGNSLDQDPNTAGNQNYQITFTTGVAGQTMTNVTPPFVTGTTPFPGSSNIPTNLKIFVTFSQTMDASTLNATNITLSGATLSNFTYDATSSVLAVSVSALTANTPYTLTVGTGVKNNKGYGLPGPYVSVFSTGSGADVTAPNIVGVIPAPNSQLTLNSVNFIFSTDDYLDFTTATSGSVTLSSGGNNLPGTVSYDPVAKELHFAATNVLPQNSTITMTVVANNLANISGIKIANKVYSWTTEPTNSDVTGPSVLYANADGFNLAVTFNKAVNAIYAKTLSNYSLTVGGQPIVFSSMAGQSISYDAFSRTAKISGLMLAPGSTFSVSVSGIRDISGNLMSGSSSVTGSVMTVQKSGGFLGPGSETGSFGPQTTDFSSAGIGFMPGTRVMPMNAFVSASTTYGFELPISRQIPSSGTIVLTFPSSSDYNVASPAATDTTNPFVSAQNLDINGPGSNTVGFTVAGDNLAKTITMTLTAATNSEGHDFLRFAIVNIKNPSIPKGPDSSGYLIDIKTKSDAGAVLESFTSSPIYISGGAIGGSATTTIQGTISGNGGNLEGVTVHMTSPQIGLLNATTNSSGVYQFTNIPANTQISSFGTGSEYMLYLDQLISGLKSGGGATTTGFFGNSMPIPVRATSTSIITRDYSLTATTSALNFDVKLTADNSGGTIFKTNEQLDLFVSGPGKFVVRTITTSATNYSAALLATLPIDGSSALSNGNWSVGIGPAMPKGMGNMSFGPPPAPGWSVTPPVSLLISGCPTACVATINGATVTSNTFTISKADKTISGVLKDGSGNVIASAQVFAFSPGLGIGNQAQTSSAGVFSINVVAGSYNVGAFVPGIGSSREVPVIVKSNGDVFVNGASTASTGSSGANPFSLNMKKPSYTITGRVTDGSNAVSNAPVFAYRTDAPGKVDAKTDSSGNYTLYVDNGTWKVNTFIQGFGPMSEQTVTISGSSQSSINFSPSTALTYNVISGIVFESGNSTISTSTQGISGVTVRVSGANGKNEAITGSDGTFTLRVPSGTYTLTDIFKPGYGRIPALDHTLAPITSIDATSNVYQPIRLNTRKTITVTVKDSSGNPLVVPRAYIDLFDMSKNFGNHAEIINGTSTTLQVANGASTTVRVFIQGVPPANISVASDDTTDVYPNNTLVLNNVLEVNSNEEVKITVNTNTAALSTISGTVYAGSQAGGNELANAWIQFVDPTNNVHFGTQATSSGIYVITLSNGTYQVQAMEAGYVSSPTSLVVSAATSSVNLLVSSSAGAVTGTVTAGGSAVSDAYVWAEKLGGGFVSTKTNTSGAYTLQVGTGSWKVFASAEGYQSSSNSNPVSAGTNGVNIALTSAASISSKTATSNTFTDTSTGSLSDSTLGLKVSVDSAALGSSGSSAYLSAKQTSNIPGSTSLNIVGGKALDISAVSGSSAVTNLQNGKTAEVTLNYSKSDLVNAGYTTTTKVGNLKISSWSDDKGSWESLTTVATYKDSSGNPVSSPASDLSNVSSVDFTTSQASHFSPYALAAPSDVAAPASPSGFAVSQQANTIYASLSWTANTESDLAGYYIYRDTSSSGTFPLLVSPGNVTSYSDRSLSVGNTYYYKISAYNNSGNESSATDAKSVAITLSATSGTSGGGGSPSIGQSSATAAAPAAVAAVPAAATPAAPAVAQPSAVAQAVSPVFNKDLSLGSRGDDVTRLQQLLKQDSSVYPEGLVTGYFGLATQAAVRKFQAKYGVSAIGRVGPATRAKLQEVFGKAVPAATPAAPAVAQPSAVAQAVSPVFNKDLSLGSRGDDVTRLQQLLKQDSSVYPEGLVTGYFGLATQAAVRKFQAKYGVSAIGRVGPATRAKLQKVFGK